jgi:excisionase family DNA binding protein
MKNNEKLTYTVPEMAKALNIGRNKAYELVKTEGFPVIYIGATIRIPIEALNRWLNECDEYI